MKVLKRTSLMAVLLIAVIMGPVVSAESPSQLLQQALYAEEVDGDIDAAIKLYEQAAKEGAEAERIAAKATYQLGVCYLKKGIEKTAAGYFQEVVNEFPGQKSIVASAREQLTKLGVERESAVKAQGELIFGPVIEKVINDDGVGKDFMLDLDSGHLFGAGDFEKGGASEEDKLRLMGKAGVDVMGETSKKSLMGFDMAAIDVRKERWDMSAVEVVEQLGQTQTAVPALMSADGELPKTYIFRTREGGKGILQILEMQDGIDPRHFKIRYKMLEKIKPETKKSVFEQIDGQVLKLIAGKYGQTAAEAESKHLYCNSHIYYVDSNFVFCRGGLSYYYNWTGRTITGKVNLGVTSYPNQTLYDATGNKLNTEIVSDKTRPNHWQIYWTPDEPLAPQEALYYGWSVDETRKLPQMPGEAYFLTMQNKLGTPGLETFFLVLPKELKISQNNPPTGSQELLNFNVYWWTKAVQQSENHVERVQLEKVAEKPKDSVWSDSEAGKVAEEFLKAMDAGDVSRALKSISTKAEDILRHKGELQDACDRLPGKGIKIERLFANDTVAIGISNAFAPSESSSVKLAIQLLLKKEAGGWFIYEFDSALADLMQGKLDRFLKQYPDAKKVLGGSGTAVAGSAELSSSPGARKVNRADVLETLGGFVTAMRANDAVAAEKFTLAEGKVRPAALKKACKELVGKDFKAETLYLSNTAALAMTEDGKKFRVVMLLEKTGDVWYVVGFDMNGGDGEIKEFQRNHPDAGKYRLHTADDGTVGYET